MTRRALPRQYHLETNAVFPVSLPHHPTLPGAAVPAGVSQVGKTTLARRSRCIVRLPPYASNPASGLVKSPKLLWADCGLAAWLAGITDKTTLRRRQDLGFWLEQAVFMSLQTWRSLDVARRRLLALEVKLGIEARLDDAALLQSAGPWSILGAVPTAANKRGVCHGQS